MNREQFAEWQSNPTTIEIFEKLEGVRADLEKGLASGQTLCTTADETHGSTARMIGNIEGLNQLLDISFEDDEEDTGKEEEKET